MALGAGRIAEADFIARTLPGDGYDPITAALSRRAARQPRMVALRSPKLVPKIRGNAYRLVVAADFEKGIVWIKWLGTHRDYDRIDAREVDRD
jgi:hypothetical protein